MSIDVRFYSDLATLAGGAEFRVPFGTPRSVKDLIESLGVPHTEVALVVVDSQPTSFDQGLRDGERVAVFPPFSSIELAGTTTVLPPPIEPRFVLDVHLGTLARRLRLLGFDAWYRTDTDDDELARIAADEQRILLSRDRGLLMRRVILHGYCPRSSDPELQALEVLRRYELVARLAPLTRCVSCNGRLHPVDKALVVDRLPPRTRQEFDAFAQCESCQQVYWRGSHVDAVSDFLDRAASI